LVDGTLENNSKVYFSIQAFPSKKGFCDNARELGVENSDYKGSCLVLLQNCKMTPEEFVEHIMGNFLRGYDETL
jgi:hypothetical protein